MVPRPRDGPSRCLTLPFSVLRLLSRQRQACCWFRDPQSLAPATGPAVNKPVLSTTGPGSDPAAHLASRDGRKGELKAAGVAFVTEGHGGDRVVVQHADSFW